MESFTVNPASAATINIQDGKLVVSVSDAGVGQYSSSNAKPTLTPAPVANGLGDVILYPGFPWTRNRPWKKGDPKPSDMVQMMDFGARIGTFNEMPNSNVDTTNYDTSPYPFNSSRHADIILGGITQTAFVPNEQHRWYLTNVIKGHGCCKLGILGNGKVQSVNVTLQAARGGDSGGRFVLSTEPGALIGDNVFVEYDGNYPQFQGVVDGDLPGVPRWPADKPVYLNYDLRAFVDASMLLELTGYNR